eukprot:m.124567 g.124567  ORF g.124567 m.124567 type:complete len:110 (+) comp14652_c1_seq1:731-1060(+)
MEDKSELAELQMHWMQHVAAADKRAGEMDLDKGGVVNVGGVPSALQHAMLAAQHQHQHHLQLQQHHHMQAMGMEHLQLPLEPMVVASMEEHKRKMMLEASMHKRSRHEE